ncbi:MAG: DUF2249 domain-containing protein [Bacteroidetes bacterium]|nr:DUF2249 domain-containing protein [Bacteroidota bacterium]
MAVENTVTLDVRDVLPWDRHPMIFDALDALPVGETLMLINDHEPKPLYYELMHERPDQFEYRVEQKGPREWVAYFHKVA